MQVNTSLTWEPEFNAEKKYMKFDEETRTITKTPACAPPFSELWLCINNKAMSVAKRLRVFNEAVTSYRHTILAKAKKRNADIINATVFVDVIYVFGKNYFTLLRRQSLGDRLQTILLPWKNPEDDQNSDSSKRSPSNRDSTAGVMLNTRYYEWTGVKPPCDWWDASQHFLFDSHHCQPYESFSGANTIAMETIDNRPSLEMDYTAIGKYYRWAEC